MAAAVNPWDHSALSLEDTPSKGMFDSGLRLPTDLSTLHHQLDVQYTSPGRTTSSYTMSYTGGGPLASPMPISPFAMTPSGTIVGQKFAASFQSPSIIRRKRGAEEVCPSSRLVVCSRTGADCTLPVCACS